MERLEAVQARGVDQHGHRSQLCADGGECFVDLGAVGDVGDVGEVIVGRVEIERGDVEAVRTQSIGDRLADARTASGHDGILHVLDLPRAVVFETKNLDSEYENRILAVGETARYGTIDAADWVFGRQQDQAD